VSVAVIDRVELWFAIEGVSPMNHAPVEDADNFAPEADADVTKSIARVWRLIIAPALFCKSKAIVYTPWFTAERNGNIAM